MEYKQGLDRVGDSTSFPFPIKLEYDSENIYLTPLWIPETSDILVAKDKITKQPINLLDANELGNLWLCLEVKDGINYRIRRWNEEQNKRVRLNHLSRGGKFHLTFGLSGAFNDSVSNFLTVGDTYNFPYSSIDFGWHGGPRRTIHWLHDIKGKTSATKWFVYIRGTYRYGSFHDEDGHDLKRTGIYSNVVKLEFNLN